MRYRLQTWLAILVGGGLCLTAHALRPSPTREQFSSIPERNVFGLKSGPAAPEPAAKGPPPKLMLTGITTVLGNKLVLMREAIPATPGVPAQEKPLMLSEGQREGDIEVLEINEKQGSVRVNDAGEILTLTFEKNGVKPPGPGSAGAVAGASGLPPGTHAAPAYAPGRNTRMRVLPMRMPRAPAAAPPAAPETGATGPETGTAAPEASAAAAAGTTPGVAAPTTALESDRALSPTGPTNAAPAQAQLSPEAQALLEALQQAANETNTPAPAPVPPALAPPPGSPYPSMPPGASLQRQRPPFYPQ